MTRVDILVVDDSAVDAEMTRFALRRAAPRARALWLRNGDQALQFLAGVGEFSQRVQGLPRLVLMESHMPAISGLSVLDVIRAHPTTKHLRVVMLSRSCNPRIYRRGDQFDANAYIARSFDHEEYCTQIEAVIDRWLPELRNAERAQVLHFPRSADVAQLRH